MKQERGMGDMWMSRGGTVSTSREELLVTFTLKNGESFTVDEFIQPVIDGNKWYYV